MRILVLTSLLALLASCNNSRLEGEEGMLDGIPSRSSREASCRPASSASRLSYLEYQGGKAGQLSFNDIRSSLSSACASCHQFPAAKGKFSYLDSYHGAEMVVDGQAKLIPGLSQAAERIRDVLIGEKMPPEDIRLLNPKAYLKIGHEVRLWIAKGKVEGSFDVSGEPGLDIALRYVEGSDLGDCIPEPEIAGHDPYRDQKFAEAVSLPLHLSDTDLFSLDAYSLAQRGTFAYNVEYALWADNAEKGRWVHLPARARPDNSWRREPIRRDLATGKFIIPENTRFYKTFFKPVKQKDGSTKFKKIETRIIVTRTPWEKSLFGTYRWDESESSAKLVEIPYRDGSPFRDIVFAFTADETTGRKRKYALPARHRCVECHMGSEGGNFVLGFTPLQINRRRIGEAGRLDPVGPAELSQVARFFRYGILDGIPGPEVLPKLETLGTSPPRNAHELRAQGYFTGNCAHCHSPQGFAMKLNEVKLNLEPGRIFDFDTKQSSIHFAAGQGKRFVNHEGDLERSYLYERLSLPPEKQGMFSRMPMHTPGSPDCKVLNVVGKWIKTWESEESANQFKVKCEPVEDDFHWVEEDFTWPQSDKYVPRRQDWPDPESGMPEKFRVVRFTESLRQAVSRKYAIGYWRRKAACKFPAVTLPAEQQRPWMFKEDGSLKRPYGEVYETLPGSWFFANNCRNCHGARADGNSTFATGLLKWSGGSVRVANLIDGMFGKRTENLKTFDVVEGGQTRNFGGNYLIWMAMGGTKVKFPEDASKYLGKHKAEMLNMIRERCVEHIASAPAGAKSYEQEFEVFTRICFHENGAPDSPELQFVSGKPVNPEAQANWMDRAAMNAGWAITHYLEQAALDRWEPSNDECEKVYPKP